MKRILGLSTLGLALLPLGLRADHLDFVTVSATASPVYLKERMAKGSPRRETYTFMEGKFFGGETNDPSIDKATFLELAHALAPNLAEQNYFPARTARSANLLIVVNWGTTLEDFWSGPSGGDTEYQLQLAQVNRDLATYQAAAQSNGAMPSQALAAASRMYADTNLYQSENMAVTQTYEQGYNAGLLGYTAQLAQDWNHQDPNGIHLSPELTTHLSDLVEERYFVILLAYDYQDILRNYRADHGRTAANRPQPLPVWEVRMNVRAAGNNFTQALPAMAKVAASFYGKNLKGLTTLQTEMGKAGHVLVGAPRVLDVIK